jgi:squalene synthase HpnC
MGVGHYENFPVASILLPARLRAPVRAIYRFARTADDIADEGSASPAERLAALGALQAQIEAIESGRPSEWPDLAAAVREHALPTPLLRDLLSAFAQDVTVARYADFDALLDYCRRSANPIGRLLLALFDRGEAPLQRQSDAICSALQCVNFWQDVALDWARGRIYIPQAILRQFEVTEADIAAGRADGRWRALMRDLAERAREMLSSGAPLAAALGGRVGLELRMVIQGGLRILERIDAADGDVFRRRPVLRTFDWAVLAGRALTM